MRRMNRWEYAVFSGLSIGVLGGLTFFIWNLINNSFKIQPALFSALQALIIFLILGFILGLIIGELD